MGDSLRQQLTVSRSEAPAVSSAMPEPAERYSSGLGGPRGPGDRHAKGTGRGADGCGRAGRTGGDCGLLLAVSCGGDSGGGSPASPSASVPSGTFAGSTQVPALADMLAEKRLGSADAPNVVIQDLVARLLALRRLPHPDAAGAEVAVHVDKGTAAFVYRDFPLDSTSLNRRDGSAVRGETAATSRRSTRIPRTRRSRRGRAPPIPGVRCRRCFATPGSRSR